MPNPLFLVFFAPPLALPLTAPAKKPGAAMKASLEEAAANAKRFSTKLKKQGLPPSVAGIPPKAHAEVLAAIKAAEAHQDGYEQIFTDQNGASMSVRAPGTHVDYRAENKIVSFVSQR